MSSVFFFSSRRRHTRLVSDWSSDVCSSDLLRETGSASRFVYVICDRQASSWREVGTALVESWRRENREEGPVRLFAVQVGRASCRERVWISMGGSCVQ